MPQIGQLTVIWKMLRPIVEATVSSRSSGTSWVDRLTPTLAQ